MKRVVFISGGTSGLGLQVVKDLVDKNYKVYSLSKSKDKINKIENEFYGAEFYCGNVADESNIRKIYQVIYDNCGHLDVIVNNAGIILPGGVEKLSADDWNTMFNVNVNSIFLTTKILLPLLKKSEAASIINVSSISSKMTGSSIAYSAGKAAVDMMTKSLAKELAAYGIRVNGVNPGIMNTGFQVHNNLIAENNYNDFLKDIESTYPLGVGTAKDVSNLIMFLISKEAKWITGSNYIIDGGKSINI